MSFRVFPFLSTCGFVLGATCDKTSLHNQGPDVPNSKAHEIWGDGVRFHGCEPEPWYNKNYEQWKKGTLVVYRVDRGWNTTQLCGDDFKNHEIRIPLKPISISRKVKDPVCLFVALIWKNGYSPWSFTAIESFRDSTALARYCCQFNAWIAWDGYKIYRILIEKVGYCKQFLAGSVDLSHQLVVLDVFIWWFLSFYQVP